MTHAEGNPNCRNPNPRVGRCWDSSLASFGFTNVRGMGSWLEGTCPTGSGEKWWYAGYPFAVDHFRQISRGAFHDPIEECLALLCGGEGGLRIGLLGPDRSADIVRKRGKRDGGFKLLRVTRQVLGESVAVL